MIYRKILNWMLCQLFLRQNKRYKKYRNSCISSDDIYRISRCDTSFKLLPNYLWTTEVEEKWKIFAIISEHSPICNLVSVAGLAMLIYYEWRAFFHTICLRNISMWNFALTIVNSTKNIPFGAVVLIWCYSLGKILLSMKIDCNDFFPYSTKKIAEWRHKMDQNFISISYSIIFMRMT